MALKIEMLDLMRLQLYCEWNEEISKSKYNEITWKSTEELSINCHLFTKIWCLKNFKWEREKFIWSQEFCLPEIKWIEFTKIRIRLLLKIILWQCCFSFRLLQAKNHNTTRFQKGQATCPCSEVCNLWMYGFLHHNLNTVFPSIPSSLQF